MDLLRDIPRFMGSFEIFCRECLGYTDMNKKHSDLCTFIQTDPHDSLLILMPRFTFKSCICTQAYSLWCLVRDPDMRILIYSDSSTKASGFLQGIKNHIEGKARNSKFRQYFGEWETTPQSGKWNDSQIIVEVRKVAAVEPSVDTGGIETSKVGMHYDLIIFDDIVSDVNVTTKMLMDKTYDLYKKALSLLKPRGKVIMVGTRWHFGDAYGRIIAENKDVWGTFLARAHDGDKYYFDDIGENSLTPDFLLKQRSEQGSYIFSCLYQNNPVDDETALFKASEFRFYQQVDHKNLFKTCVCDPAGEGEDSTAITVVGTDKDMNMYVLDIINDHLKPNQIIDSIIKLNYKWGFTKFGIEGNFFKGLLEKEIQTAIQEERKNKNFTLFSMEVFTSTCRIGAGKHARIQSLQPFHERGALRLKGERIETLPGVWGELAFQMIQYPKAPHDDIVDSLAFHVQLIRPGGTVTETRPDPTSAAGLELAYFEQMSKRRRGKWRMPEMAFN